MSVAVAVLVLVLEGLSVVGTGPLIASAQGGLVRGLLLLLLWTTDLTRLPQMHNPSPSPWFAH